MCVSGFIVTVEQRECDVNTDVCLSSYRHSTSHRGCFYFEGSDRKGCASACLAAGPSSSFQIRQLQRRWRRYESWCYRGAVGLSSARRKQSKPRRQVDVRVCVYHRAHSGVITTGKRCCEVSQHRANVSLVAVSGVRQGHSCSNGFLGCGKPLWH